MGTETNEASVAGKMPVGNRWNPQVLVQYVAVAGEANLLNES